jgi:RHS repeat-associated protein
MWTDMSGQSEGNPLVHYEYDDFGNVHEVTTFSAQGVGRTTTYAYDDNNRVIAIDHPGDLGTEEFAYDEVGNLKGKMDGEGAITAYEYDELNRLVKVDYNHSCTWPDIEYPLTADVTYEYEIAYEYNALNQKTSIGISGDSPTTYSYYANGWLKSVSGHGVSNLATYSYDEVGNRTRIDYDSGTVTTYDYEEYDPRYRISEIAHDPVYGDTLTIDYGSRDGVGNPTEIESVGYDYDANSRLIEAGATSYTYDWVGNRVTPGSMVYDYADELTSWPGQHTYDYLGTGSLYEQKDSTGQTTQKTYTYTAANLLDSITHNSVQGEPVSSMTWDADSNRVSFTSSTGETWEYMCDITAGIPAVIKETGLKTYLREPDGSLIAMFVESYPYYYHFDALGSTRMLTDESGHITDGYTYDAWGNVTSHDPNSISQPYQYVGQLGYYTHYQDANLPLLRLGVRFYDPGLGRFGQVDPIGRRESAFSYASGRPMFWVDPSGQFPSCDCLSCMWNAKKEGESADFWYWWGQGRPDRPDRGNDDANAMKHCVWNCEGARACGRLCAQAVTTGWEYKNWRPGGGLPPASERDMQNNQTGLDCSQGKSSCYDCCKKVLFTPPGISGPGAR